MNRRKFVLIGYATAVAGVALATGLMAGMRSFLDKSHMGLIYLLVIVCVAALQGARPAVLAALLGFLCWNFFFLHPHYTFYLHDRRDWLLLLTFLVVGSLIGHITGRLRTRESEAIRREQEIAAMHRAMMGFSTQVSLGHVPQMLVQEAAQSAHAAGCALLIATPEEDGWTILACAGDIRDLEGETGKDLTRHAMQQAKAIGLCSAPPFVVPGETFWPITVSHQAVVPDVESRHDLFLPLTIGGENRGLLYATPPTGQVFNEFSCRLLVALASYASVSLERRRLLEETAHATAIREADKIKSVLFSSISHNLKTPLASLTATLSSLQQADVEWNHEALLEGLQLMAEDVERLTEQINDLLNLAQLESGSWKPNPDWFDLLELVSMATGSLSAGERDRIHIEIPADFPMIWVDSLQISQVIRHLTENALNYSPPGSPVIIGTEMNGTGMRFWVDDSGAGIPIKEREQVFGKFYRGQTAERKSVRGSGLGLAICREIVQSHGGQIRVETAPSGGARLIVSLPQPIARKELPDA